MNVNPYDDVVTTLGVGHSLGGLRAEYLDVARQAVESARDLNFDDPEEREVLADTVVCALRAAGLLRSGPRFVWIKAVTDGHPCGQISGRIRDIATWPSYVDVTETLFGEQPISAKKAEWAAGRLNRGESISPKAWEQHQEKMRESAS